MLNFVPPAPTKKKKQVQEIREIDEPYENMNKVIGPGYAPNTQRTMAKLCEIKLPFELIKVLLKYIKRLNVPGAVLVFLPSWNLIVALMRHLEEHAVFGPHDYCILPLHSQVPREDQRRVFKPVPSGVTKVILVTHIAETSIIIDDVVFVIDSCKVNMKLFTSHNNMTNYATGWASKTNLEQRKGRAGLVRSGFAFRLCSRARFQKLDNCTTPEICRTPLHEIALAIKLLHLGDIVKFLCKALEPPPIDAVIESEVLLREIGALDCCSELTPLGKILARLPVEPRLGKMLVLSCIFHFGEPLCIMAAHSSTFPEPFYARFPKKYATKFSVYNRWSDHLTMLNAFMQWENKHMQGVNAEQEFCEQFSAKLSTFRITHDAKNQVRDLLIYDGFPESCFKFKPHSYYFEGDDAKLDMVVALLCMGLYPNVCFHKEKQKVATIEGRTALIPRTSVNCSNLPPKFPSPFFVFGEKVRTDTVSCMQMTMITPLHLLLLGCGKVECVKGNVFVDRWINLKMSPQDAAKIVALHSVIEDLIMQVADNPEILTDLGPQNGKLIELIKRLCSLDAGKFESEKDQTETENREIKTETESPPRKRIKLSTDITHGVAS